MRGEGVTLFQAGHFRGQGKSVRRCPPTLEERVNVKFIRKLQQKKALGRHSGNSGKRGE